MGWPVAYFAAIKLWVYVNQDARLHSGEQADLASLQIISINFQTDAVTYADGHSDALSATTLQSGTEGMRYTQMQEADAQGNLHTIDAGQIRDVFDSCLRTSHERQKHFFYLKLQIHPFGGYTAKPLQVKFPPLSVNLKKAIGHLDYMELAAWNPL